MNARVRAKTDGIQMKDWDKDYETPLGEYPGCIGYIWDREFYPGSEINLLEDFDWRHIENSRGITAATTADSA